MSPATARSMISGPGSLSAAPPLRRGSAPRGSPRPGRPGSLSAAPPLRPDQVGQHRRAECHVRAASRLPLHCGEARRGFIYRYEARPGSLSAAPPLRQVVRDGRRLRMACPGSLSAAPPLRLDQGGHQPLRGVTSGQPLGCPSIAATPKQTGWSSLSPVRAASRLPLHCGSRWHERYIAMGASPGSLSAAPPLRRGGCG